MQFAKLLINWHDSYGRHNLPWQQSNDPYKIWISEIMLQQTQVKTVIPYYIRFITNFPNITSLALAAESELMEYWSGLGYYSRARNLHRCAKIMHEKYQARVPDTFEALISLPGIGFSTANAILSQAFNQKAPVVDGNVKRVISRIYAIKEPVEQSKGKKIIEQIALENMPDENTRQYTQAIMDLGATVCRKVPECSHCPFNDHCAAKSQGLIHVLPILKKPTPTKKVTMHFHVFRNENKQYALRWRDQSIWKSLLCFPDMPESGSTPHQLQQRHILTHRELNITYNVMPDAPQGIDQWLTKSEIISSAIPQAIRKIIEKIDQSIEQSLIGDNQ
tara:strand:- start:6583 stop:7584 length:1002 start_codon:yes stop_codon:yes gene_type:complete